MVKAQSRPRQDDCGSDQGTGTAIAGSDDANGDSGHCSDEGWKGQGTAAEAGGGSGTGLGARLGGGNVRWLFG